MRLERKRGRPAGFALPKNAAIARSKSRSACCWSIVLRHVDALHEGTPAGVLSAARQVGGHRGWPSSASCSTECSAPAPSRTPSRSASSQLASYQLASLTVVTAALVQLLPSDSARLSLASRISRRRLRACRGCRANGPARRGTEPSAACAFRRSGRRAAGGVPSRARAASAANEPFLAL